MKRKLLLTLLVLVCSLCCAFGFIACGESDKSDGSNGGGNVNVFVEVDSIMLNQSLMTLEVGQSAILVASIKPDNATDQSVQWLSGDESIVTVNNGTVVAIAKGETTVTAYSSNNKQAVCLVEVKEPAKADVPVTSIAFEEPMVYLKVGDERLLKLNIEPAAASDNKITWSANPEGVVTVENGMVTAIGDGTAFVWASTGGKNAHCEVFVSSATAGLKINIYEDDGRYGVVYGLDGDASEVVIPSTYLGVPVRNIDRNAFSENEYITSVTISDGVKNIGERAFERCINLKTVSIADSVENISQSAFWGCESLENVILPKNLTEVANNLFSECTNLKSVVIPEGVTKVGTEVFMNCGSEKNPVKVSVPDSVKEFGTSYGAHFDYNETGNLLYLGNDDNPYVILTGTSDNKASDSYTIMKGTKIIFQTVFAQSEISSIEIPDGVVYIGDSLFISCYYLTTVHIPASVEYIGGSFVYNCENLESITVDEENQYYSSANGMLFDKDTTTLIQVPQLYSGKVEIPEGVVTVTEYALNQCYNVTEISVPASVEDLSWYPFMSCDNIEKITVAEGNQNYSSQDGILYNKAKTEILRIPEKLKGDIVIPNGITSLNAEFRNTEITSIVVPDSVTEIGNYAFAGCYFIEKMTLPFVGGYAARQNSTAHFGYIFGGNATSGNYGDIPDNSRVPQSLKEVVITHDIGTADYAFYGCNNIEKITFTNSDASENYVVGRYAFGDCSKLQTLILANGVYEIDAYAFNGCNSLKALVLPQTVSRTSGCDAPDLVVYFTGSNWKFTDSFAGVTHYLFGEWEYVDGVPTVKA